ncbi:MAG: hypothetical protein FP831_13600 [Anaerolineae bacterium]|nr:hypothetical protein [Anaerolineae bacterium]
MKKLNWVFVIVFLLMIGTFGVVYATYTGPNRSTYVSNVTTYWERKHCSYEAWYDPAGTGWWGCHADNYTSPNSGCPGFSNWTNSACGWPGGAHVDGTSESSSIEGCSSGQSGCTSRTEDNSYWSTQNPATVSGINQCTTTGKNGWCVAGATISLSGSDPVYTATGIEGSVNGAVTTLCSSTSCSWSYPQGEINLDYWTLSSHGDTSNSSSTTMKFDSIAPTGELTFDTLGDIDGGWVISKQSTFDYYNVTEEGSGIASAGIRVNGGSLLTLPTTVNFTEGPVSITGTLEDNAGNVGTLQSYSFNVDFTEPVGTINVDKTPNSANWFNQPVTISATGTDNLSGFDYTEFNFTDPDDNALGHGTLPTTINDAGVYNAGFDVHDVAGNIQNLNATYNLDTTPPTLSPTLSGTLGNNGWYTSSSVKVNFNATDNLSGVDQYLPENPFIVSGEGGNSKNVQVVDLAGNESEVVVVNIKIDSERPTMAPTIQGTVGKNGYYVSNVVVRGHADDETSGVYIDPMITYSADGNYDNISLTAEDYAGNTYTTLLADPVLVDQTKPEVTINSIDPKILATVTFSGTAADVTSGLDAVSFSDDAGTTWKPTTLNIDGTWSISVDTTKFPGGTRSFIAKATDKAGNENTATVSSNVSNKTAAISLTSQWTLGQTGKITIIPGDSPVKTITISICDPNGAYECIKNTYQSDQIPSEINWNGQFGSSMAAPGEYDVEVILEDTNNGTSGATATILIPFPTPPPTTEQTEAVAVFTETPEPEYTEEPTEQAPVVYANETKPSTNPIQQWIEAEVKFKSAPYAILITFFGVFAANVVADPRPKQWDKVGKTVQKNNTINNTENQKKKP